MSAPVSGSRLRRRFAMDLRPVDRILAAVLMVVALAQVLAVLPIAPRPIGVAVAVGSTAPIVWRRKYPIVAALVGSAVWLIPTDGFVLVGYVAAFLLFYSVTAEATDRYLAGAAVLVGTVFGIIGTAEQGLGVGEYGGAVFGVVAPAVVGALVRRQRRHTGRLEQLTVHLERERDQRERAAIVDERARIARELHDLVSHAVSVVAVQADAAEAALERDPELAKRPLSAIRDSAAEALTEMRRLLGVLRTDTGEVDREPLPGLAQLPALVDRAREGGLTVELTVDGTPVPLPPSLNLTAYRIVQEALTNAVKHAPGAPVSITLRWLADSLEIKVGDQGPGAQGVAPPDAHGLVGMRERVRIHGGEFEAGNVEHRGFGIRALLPIEAS